MSKKQAVSIVVPTLNEAGNIPTLLHRISTSLKIADIPYEIVIVDDHSSDNTVRVANELSGKHPVKTFTKQGKRGKAYSLLEGFKHCTHNLVAMIDADLQYPPEELVAMHRLLTKNDAHIIVTKREAQKTSFMRKLSTHMYNLIFARLLFGINFDTQSGLKLFRKEILDDMEMKPSPWSFDLEFLVRSLENRLHIISHTIPFEKRTTGITKVKLLNTTFELINASVRLRARTSAREIRAGCRANNSYLKKAMPAIALGVFLSLGSLQLPTAASAATSAANTSTSRTAAGFAQLETSNPSAVATTSVDRSKLSAAKAQAATRIYASSPKPLDTAAAQSYTQLSFVVLAVGAILITASVLLSRTGKTATQAQGTNQA